MRRAAASLQGKRAAALASLPLAYGLYLGAWAGSDAAAELPPGATAGSLPPAAVSVQANGQGYEYLNGIFYQASYGSSGQVSYPVVQAPLGATVSSLPQGVKPNEINGAAYYDYGSTWFRACFSGSQAVYRVVHDPLV
jgi:hypothetical protein